MNTVSIAPLYHVQNIDRIARPKDYDHLNDGELLVHGMFATLQGEGPYAGCPSVFLRLAGCNFGDKIGFCEFCDTDFRLASGMIYDTETLVYKLEDLWTKNTKSKERLLIITGGEPGLQRKNLVNFMWYMYVKGWNIQVETNGTQNKFAVEVQASVPRALLVVSPKAGLSGYGALNVKTWAFGKNVLKVLVDARPESQYHQLPEFVNEWNHYADIYLSPIAVYAKEYKGEVSSAWEEGLINKELTRRNYNYAAKLCLERGYKLSIQQHIFAEIE